MKNGERVVFWWWNSVYGELEHVVLEMCLDCGGKLGCCYVVVVVEMKWDCVYGEWGEFY